MKKMSFENLGLSPTRRYLFPFVDDFFRGSQSEKLNGLTRCFFTQILQRPGPEPWMFDEEGNLKEMQVKFDWKAVDFRQDMLGGNEPNMLEG
mmetsp:Transcript_48271/g.109682  ORF Transcript_48271/g.109682 Transcript_48271/m.109682 type:complete len:92 (+) Transcript_48271:327-602(+)